jgi:hypothetical protein
VAGPSTTTVTTPGGTNTTNVTNFSTGTGANAGGKNNGESGDGKGKDKDSDKGTSTGGAGCEAPPVSSGGDPLLQMQIQQTWLLRCGDGKKNPLPDTGVAGDQGGGAHPTVGDVVKDGGVTEAIAKGGNDAGFGLSRSCPVLNIEPLQIRGRSIALPTSKLCDLLAALAVLVLLVGHVQWAFIVAAIGAK